MPRHYKKKLGARPYKNYEEETLLLCLDAIKSGKLSQRKAAEIYKIPRRTIINKLGGKHFKKTGSPPVFTEVEEEKFVFCISKMGECGFPVTKLDLKYIIKTYLDQIGRQVSRFRDNLPGREWVLCFLNRHPELSTRFAANIKRNRAALTVEDLKSFIIYLAMELEGVPPSNIINFDETNLVDDPGKNKVMVRRGVKYVEKIRNTSKSGTSIMFAGSASGELLPLYVYKSQKMWSTWTENGPPQTRYNNSLSGWFDQNIFLDWFQSILIPYLKKLDGKKVVICDNLSSHISLNVIKLCEANDVKFVCLPPNSTHLTQPLDVSVFRGVKSEWRKLLGEWKDMNRDTVRKDDFPTLLKNLMERIKPKVQKNLVAGFRACGIAPCSVDELLKRIPGSNEIDTSGEIESSFLASLKKTRAAWTEKKKTGKRKKLDIPPGKSISSFDLQSTSTPQGKKQPKNNQQDDSGSSLDEEEWDPITVDESDDDMEQIVERMEKEKEEEAMDEVGFVPQFEQVQKEVGKFCVVQYDKQLFPGKIISFDNESAQVSAMQKSLKSWKWPSPVDVIDY